MADRRAFGRRRHLAALLAFVAAAPLLGACGSDEKEPLQGTRISVLAHEREIAADPGANLEQIRLPPAELNADWPTAGGTVGNARQHLALAEKTRLAWSADIGTGVARDRPRMPSPVVGDGRVYTMDSQHVVSAYAVEDGSRVWRIDLAGGQGDRDSIAGGLTYDNGRVFVATGFARVMALDAASGAVLWRTSIANPVHADPTAAGGRLFLITLDSRLIALDAASGAELWTYQAIGETARLIGGGGPAVDAGVVVAPFSSGELVALRQENGRVLWSDSLAATRRTDELAAVAQIHAGPVIDRGGVFAISYGGLLAAIDLRIGSRVWEQDMGGLFRPWTAGGFVYQLTKDNDLVCMSRVDGRVYWVTSLPDYEHEAKQKDPMLWLGPVLAGNRLLVASTSGRMFSVSPYDGSILDRDHLGDGAAEPPIVADGTLFVLLKDATLEAYR